MARSELAALMILPSVTLKWDNHLLGDGVERESEDPGVEEGSECFSHFNESSGSFEVTLVHEEEHQDYCDWEASSVDEASFSWFWAVVSVN